MRISDGVQTCALPISSSRAPSAALTFIYDGHVADDKEVTQVSVLSGTETLRIRRKPDVEQAFRNVLRKLGFKKASRKSLALAGSAGEMLQMPDDAAWLAFMDKGLPKRSEEHTSELQSLMRISYAV